MPEWTESPALEVIQSKIRDKLELVSAAGKSSSTGRTSQGEELGTRTSLIGLIVGILVRREVQR